jgi:hypothetical protein
MSRNLMACLLNISEVWLVLHMFYTSISVLFCPETGDKTYRFKYNLGTCLKYQKKFPGPAGWICHPSLKEDWYTFIRFVWVSAKFGTCTGVSEIGTLVESKM